MTEQGKDRPGGQKTIQSIRPWGKIQMIVRNQPCSVDLTYVNPHSRASLHSHNVRAELFHFVDQGAYLELDGKVYQPKAGEEFMILPGVKHRFWAEEESFHILVISFGEWRAEDQYRHQDDYGRKGQKLIL